MNSTKTNVEFFDMMRRGNLTLRKQEASEVLARIKEAIAVYGFTAAELGVGPAVGKPIGQRPGKPGRKSEKKGRHQR